MLKNKKAVEINITTIIILVLAILVLVILAMYFSGGMKSLWDMIRGRSTLYNQGDVDAAKQLCESRDDIGYCSQQVTLYNKQNGSAAYYYCYEYPVNADLRWAVNGSVKWRHGNAKGSCEVYQ